MQTYILIKVINLKEYSIINKTNNKEITQLNILIKEFIIFLLIIVSIINYECHINLCYYLIFFLFLFVFFIYPQSNYDLSFISSSEGRGRNK